MKISGIVDKLSLLLFSRNDTEKALSLIGDMYDSVDEIVLFDSSDNKTHEALLKEQKSRKLSKLRIFYIVALGYLEPAVMYAFTKCRYEWILLLGTDERASPELRKDFRKILRGSDASAFAVRRYEDVSAGNRGANFNWQIRIYRKGKAQFRGLIHEEPIITGRLERLEDPKYFLDHVSEIRGNASAQYHQMEKYMRMSYAIFNETMLDYLYKFTMPQTRNAHKTLIGRIGSGILVGYEKLTGRKDWQEISTFDYFNFYALRTFVTAIKERRIIGFFEAPRDAWNWSSTISRWKNERDGKEVFEISKILREKGLTRFLELDKEKTIIGLNRKYRNRKQGVELLMNLLKERYGKEYAKRRTP